MMMQAGGDYGIEMMVAYECWRVGQVIFPNPFLRQFLIETGRARVLPGVRSGSIYRAPVTK